MTNRPTQPYERIYQRRDARRLASIIVVTLGATLLTGCQWPPSWSPEPKGPGGPTGPGPAKEPTITIVPETERADIVQVANFVPTNPWLIFDPLDGKIDGFKCNIYLGANHEGKFKGFFGDGTIVVQMFADVGKDEAKSDMKLAHTWELTPDDAYPWRARKQTMLGWGYGLRLQWPKELELGGRKIAILVSYRRTDGRMISSSKPTVRRVPIRGV
ncbi:MAG TPA: hypothetical protein P5081_12180 [Phycisphaerae bacterium]|nr:hypothetical protein [Phycisphaerae bacterium]HRW53633.1 hypothetical protein [Phycisphaerae bacterium]